MFVQIGDSIINMDKVEAIVPAINKDKETCICFGNLDHYTIVNKNFNDVVQILKIHDIIK